jgi:hypothetical protein
MPTKTYLTLRSLRALARRHLEARNAHPAAFQIGLGTPCTRAQVSQYQVCAFHELMRTLMLGV